MMSVADGQLGGKVPFAFVVEGEFFCVDLEVVHRWLVNKID